MSGDDSSAASLEARTQAFLAEFFDRGQELVRDLIEENEALRTRLSTIESSGSSSGDLVDRLRARIAELEAECERMRSLAGSVQQESGGYRQRLEELEVAHYHLAARQVSAAQLRAAASLDEAVRTTTEILLNLVGIGRFVVHGVDRERSVLFPMWFEGRGRDEGGPQEITLAGQEPLQRAATATDVWLVPEPKPRDLSTPLAVPLIGGGRAVGVVELVRFLPQKPEFTDDDLALLELISSESGAALDAAWTRAHARDVPFSRSGAEALLR